MRLPLPSAAALAFAIVSCGPTQTFEEQIEADITKYITSGACEDYPAGTTVSNVEVGEIVDIGVDGMTDVSYAFDYTVDGVTEHAESAMLYIKTGSKYQLASMGSDCEVDSPFE